MPARNRRIFIEFKLPIPNMVRARFSLGAVVVHWILVVVSTLQVNMIQITLLPVFIIAFIASLYNQVAYDVIARRREALFQQIIIVLLYLRSTRSRPHYVIGQTWSRPFGHSIRFGSDRKSCS